MNQRHGWGQVSGHLLFSCCSKRSGEGHCKVGLASFVPRLNDSAHMREKRLCPTIREWPEHVPQTGEAAERPEQALLTLFKQATTTIFHKRHQNSAFPHE